MDHVSKPPPLDPQPGVKASIDRTAPHTLGLEDMPPQVYRPPSHHPWPFLGSPMAVPWSRWDLLKQVFLSKSRHISLGEAPLQEATRWTVLRVVLRSLRCKNQVHHFFKALARGLLTAKDPVPGPVSQHKCPFLRCHSE